MFVKIIKTFNGAVEIWLMKDPDNGMRLFYFRDILEGDAIETAKDFLAMMEHFPFVCLEESITVIPSTVDLILM